MRIWVRIVSSCLVASLLGCTGSKTAPPAGKAGGLLAVHRREAPTRVFSAEEEIPTTSYAFEGAKGNVRVTMEIEGTSSSSPSTPPSINDVLFQAVGEAD